MARLQPVDALEVDATRREIHLVTREEIEELAAAPRRFRFLPRRVDGDAVVQESPWLLLSVVALTVPLTWFLHQMMHRLGF